MDKREKVIGRLLRRFKGVPNFENIDAEELVDEAIETLGSDVSAELLTLYAQYQGAWQIAFSVAHYFKFTDGEESVDKSMIADNYRKLAKDFQEEYEREKAKVLGNNFRIMSRADRPITSPPTGGNN